MFDLQKELSKLSDAINTKMDKLLPHPENETSNVISFKDRYIDSQKSIGGEAIIAEAMRYSALSGGKRLRPYLTISCANLFGISRETSLYTASAIEFIHTYSLIHDDLPAMDNDSLRRGEPSCHIKFGEATAILAGDALLTLAFELLASVDVHSDPSVRCELIRASAHAAGYRGMVGGQMLDLSAENQVLNIDEIIRLQRLKTGEMFAVSCEAGAILGKAPRNLRNALHRYAHDIGLAFQITDDLLDAEGTRDETGKEVSKDNDAGKATLVASLGIKRAKEQAQILAEQAESHLLPFDERANNLRTLAKYVITRKN